VYNAEMIGGIGNIQPFGGLTSKLTLSKFKLPLQIVLKKQQVVAYLGRFISD